MPFGEILGHSEDGVLIYSCDDTGYYFGTLICLFAVLFGYIMYIYIYIYI